jgi:surface-anchored protein
LSIPFRRAAAVLAAVPATLACAASAQANGLPAVLSQGHVDVIDVGYEDGRLALSVHDESVEPAVERDPRTVVFVVKSRARTQIPDDPAFSFLGRPGAPVWVLPEVQDPELLWPGLSTEELEAGTFAGDSVRLTLKSAIGPDGVSLFGSDPFGAPVKRLDTEDAVPDVLDLPIGTHEHDNWAFERPGLYLLTFQAGARLVDGRRLTSAPATLPFVVLP